MAEAGHSGARPPPSLLRTRAQHSLLGCEPSLVPEGLFVAETVFASRFPFSPPVASRERFLCGAVISSASGFSGEGPRTWLVPVFLTREARSGGSFRAVACPPSAGLAGGPALAAGRDL